MNAGSPEKKTVERVYIVKTPGNFVIGSDPKNHSPETLPDGTPKGDYIRGTNPRWDYWLLRHLKGALPVKRALEPDHKHWEGQPGLLQVDSQFFSLIQRYHPEGNHGSTIKIVDQGEPAFKGTKLYIPEPEDRDGKFELTVDAFQIKEPATISYWRGRLRLSGQKPGILISTSINFLNEKIKELSVPVWQVFEPQFEPRIHPY